MKNSTMGLFYLFLLICVGFFVYKNSLEYQDLSKFNTLENNIDTITYLQDTIHIERATRYNAVKEQCEGNPLITADGSNININQLNAGQIRWCALSRDLIYDEYRQTLYKDVFRGVFRFGDTLEIYSESTPMINGKWILHDTMNKRYKNSIDFLLPNNSFNFGVIKDCKIWKL